MGVRFTPDGISRYGIVILSHGQRVSGRIDTNYSIGKGIDSGNGNNPLNRKGHGGEYQELNNAYKKTFTTVCHRKAKVQKACCLLHGNANK